MRTDELDYLLPAELIATEPAEPRDEARLLVIRRDREVLEDHRVCDLPMIDGLLAPGDLMVFNQSKVIPARFAGRRLNSGGKVEGLYLFEPEGGEKSKVQSPKSNVGTEAEAPIWRVLLESRGTLRVGERIGLTAESELELLTRLGEGQWSVRLHSPLGTLELLQAIGSTPLPPYIRKERKHRHQSDLTVSDPQRYNTVYARYPGSVAAPTAGLHFTPTLLDRLDRMGVKRAFLTLHVGMGTFAPIRTDKLEDHPMHREWLSIPRETLDALAQVRARGGRIIPVGTTSVRALESLPTVLPMQGDFVTGTQLFIRPADSATGHTGFTFRFTDALMTNFHLPRSTLLALVAALPGVGMDRLKGWYSQAVARGYRFYSYGDAMWVH